MGLNWWLGTNDKPNDKPTAEEIAQRAKEEAERMQDLQNQFLENRRKQEKEQQEKEEKKKFESLDNQNNSKEINKKVIEETEEFKLAVQNELFNSFSNKYYKSLWKIIIDNPKPKGKNLKTIKDKEESADKVMYYMIIKKNFEANWIFEEIEKIIEYDKLSKTIKSKVADSTKKPKEDYNYFLREEKIKKWLIMEDDFLWEVHKKNMWNYVVFTDV